MAEQPGFFEQLVGSSIDETALADAKRAEMRAAGGANQVEANVGYGLQQLGQGIAGLFGKRGADAKQRIDDQFTAQLNNITPGELRTRRRIRKETADIEDDGSFEARRKMAQRAAKIANEEGDAPSLARALGAIKRIDTEEQEWRKLKANAGQAEATEIEAGLANAFDSEGTATTGRLGVENGMSGLYVEEMGQLIFRPFGEGFSLYDPNTGAGKKIDMNSPGWLAGELRKAVGVDQVQKVKNLASSANSSVMKTDRILSTLADLYEGGGVQSVIGASGSFVSFVDNLSRNVSGVLNAFAGRGVAADQSPGFSPDGSPRTWAGKDGLKNMAMDASSEWASLIQLPPGIAATSAAAQQHRAAVMEMAYMAARLAEPSNRGLSDNDIKNALTRIAGDTSNPQVMTRRFLEMQVDAYRELEHELDMFRGSMGPQVSDEAIETALLGRGYQRYKKRKEDLFNKFEITERDDGRVVFGEEDLIDVDVQPGQGALPHNAPQAPPKPVKEMTDEEAAKALNL